MTKNELEYLDSVLIGPAMLFLNQYFNFFIKEYIVLWLCLVSHPYTSRLPRASSGAAHNSSTPFTFRCGLASICFATQRRSAQRSVIISRSSFSGFLSTSLCLPHQLCHSAQVLEGRKMVWGTSTTVVGWVGEVDVGRVGSITSTMASSRIFLFSFYLSLYKVQPSVVLLTARPLTT